MAYIDASTIARAPPRRLRRSYVTAVICLLVTFIVMMAVIGETTSNSIVRATQKQKQEPRKSSNTVTINTNVNMTLPTSLSMCPNGPRKEPAWTWHKYANGNGNDGINSHDSNGDDDVVHRASTPRPRLLIAQYSGFGSYMRLLQLTSPVSHAYAKLKGYDFVTVAGTTLALPHDVDGVPVQKNSSALCEPIPRRSIFNKIGILQAVLAHNSRGKGLRVKPKKDDIPKISTQDSPANLRVGTEKSGREPSKSNGRRYLTSDASCASDSYCSSDNIPIDFPDYSYDLLLLLDADAVIYDLDFDVPSLLESPSDMLAAQVVHTEDMPHTFKINNGVTLWNLNHEKLHEVVEGWHQRAVHGITKEKLFHNDQFFLHGTLKSGNYSKYVRASDEALHYSEATKIKHFIRHRHQNWTHTGVDERIELIENVISNDICVRHEIVCDTEGPTN